MFGPMVVSSHVKFVTLSIVSPNINVIMIINFSKLEHGSTLKKHTIGGRPS